MKDDTIGAISILLAGACTMALFGPWTMHWYDFLLTAVMVAIVWPGLDWLFAKRKP